MLNLQLDQIKPNSWNCNFLGAQERAALKERMKEDGPEKTEPIVVRKVAIDYELVDGQQRWEIAGELGWKFIFAVEQVASDLQAKALCISYNRWRGRLNWFKLYDIIKSDADVGVNVYEAYRGALSVKEIESVLSLGKLFPEARRVLEESMKRHPEITLEHLHLLSLFPQNQQEGLVDKFRAPVVSQALLQALNPFLSKNDNEPPAKGNIIQSSATLQRNIASTKSTGEKAFKSSLHRPKFSEVSGRSDAGKGGSMPQDSFSQSNLAEGTESGGNFTLEDKDESALIEKKHEVQKALLIEVSYDCDCGRHYRVNFKNMSVVVQKENELFEHVDMKPRTFQVHCGKCNSDHEFAVDGTEGETKRVFCRRCKPLPRQGILDVNTGEVTWLD
ncbi:MAG: ParB/RepB/Spo0J family partition protein [Candidatus Bathyarchaeia archaeon]|jgi:hypothetical protein